jgi:hypothetical protein
MRVFLPKDIDVNKMHFEAGAVSNGVRVTRVAYEGHPLVMQTPYLGGVERTPAGMAFPISDEDTVRRQTVKELVSVLDALDERVREEGAWPGTVEEGRWRFPMPAHCSIVDADTGEAVPAAAVTEYARCASLVRCDGIWSAAGHAGIRWTPVAIRCRDRLAFAPEEIAE